MNPPILVIPDSKRKMRLETDALGYTIGGVLSQQQEDDSWKPIAYLFRAIVRGYSEATQSTLNISGGGILSKSNV